MSSAVTEAIKTEAMKAEITPAVLRGLPPAAGRIMDAAVAKTNKRVFHAAADSAEFFDHLRAHYRETRRTNVDIECDVKFVLPDGTVFDTGWGVLRNVSPSGALIGSLNLVKGAVPVRPFKVMMVLKSTPYNGIGIEAVPVRLAPEVTGLGVKFEEIFVAV
jgi:hypothetical protein